MTEREIIIGFTMYVIGKVIGFGFGVLHGRSERKERDGNGGIKALNKLPSVKPGWIPISERLPDNDRPVLVTLKWAEDDYDVAVGEYWNDSLGGHGWGSYEGHVLAWQLLPTPYREGGQ